MKEKSNEVPAVVPKKRKRLRTTILSSPEGHIFLAGFCLMLLFLVWMGLAYVLAPRKAHIYAGMVMTHLFAGRAAGMSVGYAGGLQHSLVVVVNMVIETIMVMLFFPLFIFSWRKLLVIEALRNFMDRMHQAAEANHNLIKKFGIVGLLVFVWFPFWMTGPMVGCIIGFLIGLRPWVNMSVVLGGTYLAIFSWGVLLRELHRLLQGVDPYAPMIVVAAVIVVIVSVNIILGLRNGRPSETNGKRPDDPAEGVPEGSSAEVPPEDISAKALPEDSPAENKDQ